MVKNPHRDGLRCECGSLIARLTHKGVEMKCRRCKRVWVIPISDIKGVNVFLKSNSNL